MKRCRAGGEVEGEERGTEGGGCGGEGCGGGDGKETISFRSQEPIKVVCLQYQALSAEEERVVDFHRGGLSGMDGERSSWQAEQEMEGMREVLVVRRLSQWTGLAVLAVLGLVEWLATLADMDRHRGRGGFSGAKQPQGSAKEGTSLCGEGGKSVSGAGLNALTRAQTHTRRG